MTFPASFTIISDEVSQDLAVLREFIHEFRLPGIELRSLAGRAFKDLTRDDIATVATFARDQGWRVFGCATPVFKCELDDTAAIREHRDIFSRSLEVARTLNCDLLRVFTFLRKPNPLEPSRLQRVTEHLLELVELARASGVRIGIENEHSCLTATEAEMHAVLAALPVDRVGAIWDPCNILYVPDATPPVAESVSRLVARLFHVHIKDAVRRAPTAGALSAVAMPVGVGAVDWRAHFQILRNSGYRGMLSLETHWRVAKLDEAMLHLPAGYAFSAGGEAASHICLHNLKAIVDTLD